MDPKCLSYCLTEEESIQFERDGYFILENVLPSTLLEDLSEVVDRVDGAYRESEEIGPYARSNMLDFIGKDDLFLKLLDWPQTLPKVWGILGWNIQPYNTHMVVAPTAEAGKTLEKDGPGVGFLKTAAD